MGKKLPNELWARPVASKLSERRPLTFFHRRDTENGQKRYFFAFLPITQMFLTMRCFPILNDAIFRRCSEKNIDLDVFGDV